MKTRSLRERKRRKRNFYRGLLLLFLGTCLGVYLNGRKSFQSTLNAFSNFSFSDYWDSRDTDPRQMNLLISEENLAKLHKRRKKARKQKKLSNKGKRFVDAQLIFEGDTITAKVRLKGDKKDHWGKNKFSLRVQLKGEKRLLGMRTFTLQSPRRRNMLDEWLFLNILQHEGLIGLRYHFIEMEINGDSRGIYALEESFGKELIEGNKRRDGPIIKFDEGVMYDNKKLNADQFSSTALFKKSRILPFKSKVIKLKPLLYAQYKHGEQLLDDLRLGNLSLDEAIDVKKAAALFAMADLAGARHATRWNNVRFYYNPIINKLELIAYDGNAGRKITASYHENWQEHKLDNVEVWEWKQVFFQDSAFVSMYFDKLEEITADGYLEALLDKFQGQIDTNEDILYRDYRDYRYSSGVIFHNREVLRKSISNYRNRGAGTFDRYLVELSLSTPLNQQISGTVELQCRNRSDDTLRQVSLVSAAGDTLSAIIRAIPPGKSTVNFELTDTVKITDRAVKRKKVILRGISLHCQIDGQDDAIKLPIQSVGSQFMGFQSSYIPALSSRMIQFDKNTSRWEFRPGRWTISEKIIFPKGHQLRIPEGTTINLMEGAYIMLRGRFEAEGSAEKPILITSEDTTGSIAVLESSEQSSIRYTKFSQLNTINDGVRSYTGSVTFYNSPVRLENVAFESIHCEDALNTISTSAQLDSVTFYDVFADAYDADFCNATITNTSFNRIGNDALDFSGSSIDVRNLQVDSTADKAVSVGEASVFTGRNITIENTEVALTSKDLSSIDASKISVKNSAVGVAVFIKKPEYGAASVTLNDAQFKGIKELHLVQEECVLQINDSTIEATREDVEGLLYGKMYGKKSVR